MGNAEALVRINRPVNDRYWHLVLEVPAPLYSAVPGQFFHLLCPPGAGHEPYLRRPMSLYRVRPPEHTIEFLYNVIGTGTRALARLKAGDAMAVMGPLGRGFTLGAHLRRILVVARGVGLATLAPVVPWAHRHGVALTAVLSARSAWDLMEREFAQRHPIRVLPVFDQDGSSAVDRVEALVRGLIETDRPDLVLTCGSNRLMLLLQRVCAEACVAGEIALEQQMACALGACLCCVRAIRDASGIVHKRVCAEGPVFDLQQVAGTWVHA